MKVVVIGGGIIGTASAWYLLNEGHEVHVIERQPGVAQETSFANGCQISVSHAEPWSNPRAPLKLLQWLGQEDAPLLFRLRADWLQWRWGMQFLRECTAARTAHNIRQIVALADYSRRTLTALREESGITYDDLQRGILHFYTDEKEFAHATHAAALMRELGCPRQTIDADAVIALEPALASVRTRIIGGDYTATDESGDIFQFTHALANKAIERGAQFHFNATATRLLPAQRGGTHALQGLEYIDAEGRHQTLNADAFVVAMGSFSRELVKPLGVDLLIYPGKGYSATYTITAPDLAPNISLTDDGHKLVFSRLGNRLRVAGTCEFNGHSRELNDARCQAITRRTRELFPHACDYDAPRYWTGLRPLTPSNIPYVGKTPYRNLFLNTGHGTLGWTMGCGSGKAIAEIISDKRPNVNFDFMGMPP